MPENFGRRRYKKKKKLEGKEFEKKECNGEATCCLHFLNSHHCLRVCCRERALSANMRFFLHAGVLGSKVEKTLIRGIKLACIAERSRWLRSLYLALSADANANANLTISVPEDSMFGIETSIEDWRSASFAY